MKNQKLSYLLALALGFTGYYASVPSASQAQQLSAAPMQTAQTKEGPGNQGATGGKQLRSPDVVYVPTPYEAVEAMLKVAKVGKGDVVYDLGSGDGRIPIMAVQKFNAERAVGIDINPERIREAEANLKTAGVGDRVRFLNADLFESNFSEATVVTLYLLPSLNLKLLPKLLAELKPGTRIVSHAFDMGSWKPQETIRSSGGTVYFWTIPAKGTPEYKAASEAANRKD
ncbi:MAG TPA: methyltransferase domain-containing protein [Verrucomicrobiae bacterium]|nr:methyltransferase domain-containing protein [Verrucomicrobiae bacterium]